MMDPGEERIVADALYHGLSNPISYQDPIVPSGTPAQIQGKWAVSIQYLRGVGEQQFDLEQSGNNLTGTQHGELYKAELKGSIHAAQIELRSAMAVSGNEIEWTFRGEVRDSNITGTVQMGEYGQAFWKATRA